MNYRLLLIVFGIILMVGCQSTGADAKKELDTIKFADAQWDSLQVHNNIAGTIMEVGYGYDTAIVTGSTAAAIQGLQQVDIHVFMEIWTDNVREIYDEAIDSCDIEKLSTNFDDNQQGLYVPTYVIEGDEERGIEPMAPDLKELKDLKDYPELFEDPEDPGRGRLINSPSGWELDKDIDKKVELYGLDETFNNFLPGSDSAIITSLASAYEKGEAWVGYYWEPTAVTAKYDLTLLEEPELNMMRRYLMIQLARHFLLWKLLWLFTRNFRTWHRKLQNFYQIMRQAVNWYKPH